MSTDGLTITELSIDEDTAFTVWDFAGQQVYFPTHQFFLTSRSIYLIVFNLALPNENRVKYWLRQIKATSYDRPPVILVGTHLDHESCTPEYLQRLQSNLEISFPPKQWNIVAIHFTSIKTMRGIKELTKTIRSIAVNNKLFSQKVPETYFMLERLIINEKAYNQIISWDEYCKMVVECNIPSEDIPAVTSFFHDVGSIIHFNYEQSGLNKLVILDPQWLANVMSSLISFKHQWVKAGVLSKDALPQVWKEYAPSLHETLLSLLAKFQVAVKLGSEASSYIIPSLLPSHPPSDISLLWAKFPERIVEMQFGRVYQFNFDFDFSKLLARIFSLNNDISEVHHYWKYGLILKSANESAFIEWKHQACRLIIQTRVAAHAYQQGEFLLLRLLIDMVESIVESFYPGNADDMQRLIPCSHCIDQRDILLGPFHFTYESCVNAITNGILFVFCRGVPSRPVNISYLAPDISFNDFSIITPDELQIQEQVGSGGFGLVFKGLYRDSIDVAIKELRSESNYNPPPSPVINHSVPNLLHAGMLGVSGVMSLEMMESEAEQMDKFKEFQREVSIMSGLCHPNLVQLYGITIKPYLRMVMEWCPRGDLYHFIKRCNDESLELPWPLRIRIITDVALGMRYLQNVTPPIIHRDLRSPNVFMMSEDIKAPVVAKIADFGLSLRVEHLVAGLLPTWRWLAPEVIDVSNMYYDQTADTYSFAMVMWEVVTLDIPFFEFENMKEQQIKNAIIHEDLRPSIPDSCPPELADLIKKCWSSEPNNRPRFDESLKVLSGLGERYGLFDGQKLVISSNSVTTTSAASPLLEGFAVHGSGYIKRNSPSAMDMYKKTEWMPVAMPSAKRFGLLKELSPPEQSSVYSLLLVGNQIWSGHSNGRVAVWDLEMENVIDTFTVSGARVENMILVEGCVWMCGSKISVWDAKTREALREPFEGTHSGVIKRLQWVSINPDQSYVWSGDIEGRICIWDIRSFHKVKEIKMEEPVISMTHFGDYVWIGQYRSLSIYHCETVERVRCFDANIVYSLAPCQGKIWAACNDRIRIWDARTLQYERDLEGHTSKIMCLIEAAGLVWSASFDTTILLWDTTYYMCVQELTGVHKDTITCMIEAGYGSVWSADRNNCLCVWGKPRPELEGILSSPRVRKSRHRRMRSQSFN